MTTTPNLLMLNPAPGDPTQTNAWGTMENTGRSIVDQIVGVFTQSIAGSGVTILTSMANAPDQARYAHYIFTGALTGNSTVLWPATSNRQFSVFNNTTGAFTLQLGANNGSGAAAGTTVTIPQGVSALCWSDGTNVGLRQIGLIGAQPAATFSSITVTGAANLNQGISIDDTSDVAWASGASLQGTNVNLQAFGGNAGGGVVLTNGATAWAAISDERLKTDLVPISNALDKVAVLRAVTGRYKTDAENVRRPFLIAQDVQKVLPEAVIENADGLLLLAQTDIIPLLVAALKEANSRIAALERRGAP